TADIAVDHVADVQRDAVRDERLASLYPLDVQVVDGREGRMSRGQRPVTGRRRVPAADRKDRQQGVADKLQHLALLLLDSLAHHPEIVVEQIDQSLTR